MLITLKPPTAECHRPGVLREPVIRGNYSFNTGQVNHFTAFDFFIFVASLVISTLIGVYHAWRSRMNARLEDFLMAGRSMSGIPVGLSLLASFMSAISLMGTPSEIYNASTMILWLSVSYFLVCAAAAHIYIPVFYQLKVTSAYEYLERRFNRKVRLAASFFFIFQMMIYMPIVLYAPSLALHAVTGLNMWVTIPAVGLVCTIYTALGGAKAVIWTDSFQIGLMVLGMVILCYRGVATSESFSAVWQSAVRTDRILFFEFTLNPVVRHSVWSVLIGGFCTWISLYGVNQAQVHRCLNCRDLKQAKIAVWINFPGLVLILYLCCFIGLYMSAFYENCDPAQANFVTRDDQMVLLYVMDILGGTTGLAGMYLAALFSGGLSTISSGLHSIAAVILEDFIKLYVKTHISEGRARLLSQTIAVIFGIICVEVAYLVSRFGDILEAALTVNGGLASPVLGVISLGMFFPWANETGAICGLFASLFLNAWVMLSHFGDSHPQDHLALRCVSNCNVTAFINNSRTMHLAKPLKDTTDIDDAGLIFRVSYMYYSTLAILMCTSIGLAVSYMTGFTDPQTVDPKLIVPVFDIVFPLYHLPEETRKKFRFGIDHTDKWAIKQQPRPPASTSVSQAPSQSTASARPPPPPRLSETHIKSRSHPGSSIASSAAKAKSALYPAEAKSPLYPFETEIM